MLGLTSSLDMGPMSSAEWNSIGVGSSPTRWAIFSPTRVSIWKGRSGSPEFSSSSSPAAAPFGERGWFPCCRYPSGDRRRIRRPRPSSWSDDYRGRTLGRLGRALHPTGKSFTHHCRQAHRKAHGSCCLLLGGTLSTDST